MFQRKYGAATTIGFPLITKGATDLTTAATFAAGDVKLIIDEGAPANATNNPTHEGNGWYSLALTAAELTGARIAVIVVDQTAPKVWEDQVAVVDTYGHASAQHALDLDASLDDVADAILARPIANVEPAAYRTLYGAIASLVNRVRINNDGDLEVYETDDATILATLVATATAGQPPITELDPP